MLQHRGHRGVRHPQLGRQQPAGPVDDAKARGRRLPVAERKPDEWPPRSHTQTEGSAATPDTLHRTPSFAIRRPERIGIPRPVRPLALAIARGTAPTPGAANSPAPAARPTASWTRSAGCPQRSEVDGERPRATGDGRAAHFARSLLGSGRGSRRGYPGVVSRVACGTGEGAGPPGTQGIVSTRLHGFVTAWRAWSARNRRIEPCQIVGTITLSPLFTAEEA